MLVRKSTDNRLDSILTRLACDRSGNVVVLFGLSALVLFSVAGGAVDFARWHNANNKVQAAIDAAALAGGRAIQVSPTSDPAVAIAAAEQYFNKMKPADVTATPTFTVVENGTVLKGTIEYGVHSMFLGMLGITTLQAKLGTGAVLA